MADWGLGSALWVSSCVCKKNDAADVLKEDRKVGGVDGCTKGVCGSMFAICIAWEE